MAKKGLQILLIILRGPFIALFLFTATVKGLGVRNFAFQLTLMPFDSAYAPYIAYGLPSVMALLAIIHVFQLTRLLRWGIMINWVASTVTMGVLWLFVHSILAGVFGPTHPCSCMGILDLSWQEHLRLNRAFTLLGILAIVLERSLRFSSDQKIQATVRNLVKKMRPLTSKSELS